MGIAIHREPHIELRRIRSNGAGYGAWTCWAWTIVEGGRRASGTFEGPITPGAAARKLARIVRRPSRQTWTELSEAEAQRYGMLRSQALPPSPPGLGPVTGRPVRERKGEVVARQMSSGEWGWAIRQPREGFQSLSLYTSCGYESELEAQQAGERWLGGMPEPDPVWMRSG